MKKTLLLCVTAVLLVLSSCSQDSLYGGGNGEVEKTAKLIESLEDYNSRLPKLRASRPSKGDWLIIAGADIIGAYRGGKAGSYIGSMFGPHGATAGAVVCGLICSAGSSYKAYDGFTRTGDSQLGQLQNQITAIYADSNTAEVINAAEEEAGIQISYESHYDTVSTKVAVLHNIILEELQTQEDSYVDINYGCLSEMELSIIETSEFESAFNDIVSTQSHGEDLDLTVETENIMYLFMSALQNSAFTPADVNQIVNDYISLIENSDSLTIYDKEVLYTAFSVACYSSLYWDKYLKSHGEEGK